VGIGTLFAVRPQNTINVIEPTKKRTQRKIGKGRFGFDAAIKQAINSSRTPNISISVAGVPIVLVRPKFSIIYIYQ